MNNTVVLGDVTPRVLDLIQSRKMNVLMEISTLSLERLFLSPKDNEATKAKIAIDNIFNRLSEIDNIIFNKMRWSNIGFIEECIKILNAIPETKNIYFQVQSDCLNEQELKLKSLVQRKIHVFYEDIPKSLKILGMDNNESRKISLSILGSCDSRDTVRIYDEINSTNDDIYISSYIARNSIAAAISPSIAHSKDSLNIDSPFIKKCVSLELSKTAIKETIASLKSNNYILLLDFMDERFDLMEVDGSLATLSWDYRKTQHYQSNKSGKIIPFDSHDKKIQIVKGLKKLIEECAKKIPINNIFILDLPMANHYIENGALVSFDNDKYQLERFNSFLKEIISLLKETITGINVISPPSWMIYGDKNHLWGAHPYHYNKLLYLYSASEIFSRRVQGQ